PASAIMNRPCSATAVVAASRISFAASSAIAPASATTLIWGTISGATSMIRSYPVVERPLARQRVAEAKMPGRIGPEGPPGGGGGTGQAGHSADPVERQQRRPASTGFAVGESRDGTADRVGDDLEPRRRALDRAARSDDQVIRRGAGRQ